MTTLTRVFTPTANRRLNELIGFLVLVSAAFLILALVSYSPLDPSLNTAATPLAGRAAHNWIGIFGAIVSDLALQLLGVSAFLVPVFLVVYSIRWFRSRPITSPYAKMIGALALLVFVRRVHWPAAVESSAGRAHCPLKGCWAASWPMRLIHYLNIVGAYLVCLATIAVALYLSTAFSFSGVAGVVADAVCVRLRGHGPLCRLACRAGAQEGCQRTGEEACRCQSKPVVTAQLVPRRRRCGR